MLIIVNNMHIANLCHWLAVTWSESFQVLRKVLWGWTPEYLIDENWNKTDILWRSKSVSLRYTIISSGKVLIAHISTCSLVFSEETHIQIPQPCLGRFCLMKHGSWGMGSEKFFLKIFSLSLLKVHFRFPLAGLKTRIGGRGLVLRERIW